MPKKQLSAEDIVQHRTVGQQNYCGWN